MATLGIGALAVEIGHRIAKVIGFGDTATLATLFAIHPHHASADSSFKWKHYTNQSLFTYTVVPVSRLKSTQSERGIPLLLIVSLMSSHSGSTSLRV